MNFWWPDIQDKEDAHKACGQAAGVAFFIAIVTGIVAGLQASGKINILPGIGASAFLDAGLFLIIGIGLVFHSRIAAVAGVLLYIAERVFMAKTNGMKPTGITMAIIFTLAFISGVRGAFAWHELRKIENADEAGAAGAAAEPPSKTKKIVSAVRWVCILSVAVSAGFYFIKSQSGKQAPKVTVTTSQAVEAERNIQPERNSVTPASVAAPIKEAVAEVKTTGGKTLHLKNGETVRGKVLQNDAVFYTLETSGGKQKIVIKEDIASEE